MKKILAFAGETGSGKGAVTEYLVKNYSAKMIKFSDMLKDVLERFHLDYTRENLTALSGAMRTTFGQDIMSRVLRKDIEDCQSELIVLDGARRKDDLDLIKDLPHFKFVYIESSFENRYKRIFDRGEKSDEVQKSWEEFKKDHHLETEKTIPELKVIANMIIENNGTLDELHKTVDEMLNNIN